MSRPRAVLYGPLNGEEHRWQQQGIDWCEARDYEVTALIVDPDGSQWPDVFTLLITGSVDVVVVVRHDHIPVVFPRIDVIETDRHRFEPARSRDVVSTHRRPRMLRR